MTSVHFVHFAIGGTAPKEHDYHLFGVPPFQTSPKHPTLREQEGKEVTLIFPPFLRYPIATPRRE